MVWENGCDLILMLTQFEEGGKVTIPMDLSKHDIR